MFVRLIQLGSAFLFASALTVSSPAIPGDDGIVTVKSAYPIRETVERLKSDIAGKGIKFFNEIDQSKLAADAGIKLRPSVLLIFGNPPLGTQFITASAKAGLDWPVRLLVYESEKGEVWAAYTDFDWIARRHGIESRNEQFKMASSVVASINIERAGKVASARRHSCCVSIQKPIGISVQSSLRQFSSPLPLPSDAA